jgi:hypothetical protein
MTILKFTDGEEFNLSVSLRKEYRVDGWYVLGDNTLIPVRDEQEADEYISKFSESSCRNDSAL